MKPPPLASRVQGLADPTAILAALPIVESAEVSRLVGEGGYRTTASKTSLRGVNEAFTIYEIRERKQAPAA